MAEFMHESIVFCIVGGPTCMMSSFVKKFKFAILIFFLSSRGAIQVPQLQLLQSVCSVYNISVWLSTAVDRREAMPRFVRKPHNCIAPEGKTASFKCKVLASSPPVITWWVNREFTPLWSRNVETINPIFVDVCCVNDKVVRGGEGPSK